MIQKPAELEHGAAADVRPFCAHLFGFEEVQPALQIDIQIELGTRLERQSQHMPCHGQIDGADHGGTAIRLKFEFSEIWRWSPDLVQFCIHCHPQNIPQREQKIIPQFNMDYHIDPIGSSAQIKKERRLSQKPSKSLFPPLLSTKNMSDCVYPCPCGWFNDPQKACGCAASVVTKYQKRISGPLLDRIDIHIEVPRVDYEKLSGDRLAESSECIRAHVQCPEYSNETIFEYSNFEYRIIQYHL